VVVKHLAQLNVARMRAQLSDPFMSEFMDQLSALNSLADQSAGFIWRLQTERGDATDVRAYPDDLVIVNLSVWASIGDYVNFVYKGAHAEILRSRKLWFKRMRGPHTALWWVPVGHFPTVTEAKERLSSLSSHGSTPRSFSLGNQFHTPDN
jgi:Domain of unknown function (DUF3291)